MNSTSRAYVGHRAYHYVLTVHQDTDGTPPRPTTVSGTLALRSDNTRVDAYNAALYAAKAVLKLPQTTPLVVLFYSLEPLDLP